MVKYIIILALELFNLSGFTQMKWESIEIRDSIPVRKVRPNPTYNWSKPANRKWQYLDNEKIPIIIDANLHKIASNEIIDPPFKPLQTINLLDNESQYKISVGFRNAAEFNETHIDYLKKNGIALYFDGQSGNYGDSVSVIWDGKIHNDSIVLIIRILPYIKEDYYYFDGIMDGGSLSVYYPLKYDLSNILKFAKRKKTRIIYLKSNWNKNITITL